MQTISVEEAATSFSKLLAQAEHGETILISRNGTPVAQLSQASARMSDPAAMSRLQGLGMFAGVSKISDDIKTPFAVEIEEMFYGNPDKFRL